MSDSEEPVCKRRKLEEGEEPICGRTTFEEGEESVCDRTKLEEDEEELVPLYDTSLLHFPDDLLLMIFALVDPPDLVSLSKTCERFNNISYDKSLWEVVDIRPHICTLGALMSFTDFLQPNTKFLATKGPYVNKYNPWKGPSISRIFLKTIAKNSPNLKTLILENHIINSSEVTLDDFPASLEHLGLKNCHLMRLPTEKSYFYRLEKTLPKLKVLNLSNNRWFVPHSLLALSKSTTLEHLTLKGCELSDCLPYASLAANFGFSALQILDLRMTCVSDIEVTCFNRTTTLRHLYLCAANLYSHHGNAQVTDYSITTFGGARDGHGPLNLDGGLIIIEVGSVPRPVCKLETLVIKNYPGITDITLRHAALSMKHLKYLDVTGTGCSEAGMLDFKKNRPDVRIIPDMD